MEDGRSVWADTTLWLRHEQVSGALVRLFASLYATSRREPPEGQILLAHLHPRATEASRKKRFGIEKAIFMSVPSFLQKYGDVEFRALQESSCRELESSGRANMGSEFWGVVQFAFLMHLHGKHILRIHASSISKQDMRMCLASPSSATQWLFMGSRAS